MVEVSVTTSIQVRGGPTLSLGEALEPESYAFASVELPAVGGETAVHKVVLLPDGGAVVLLGLTARFHGDAAPGGAAEIAVTPENGAERGEEFAVRGSLVIANEGALRALVAGGPRSLTLKNPGNAPVAVDVLSCRSSAGQG
ncbi:hypothetical protein ACKI1J_24685 [Streptomyces scabiei]|uniref:hypothetical protein n=1 Tax=Streptomyces scabiei TaxID=1930 RepID=UPI0038F7F25A